jgi:predicted short-subunit dehydrogenase-like oxidoreductase (DUF2520 family)
MNIVLIGAGNLANCIAPPIIDSGNTIVQIIAYTEKSARALATKVNSAYSVELESTSLNADLYIIATPDKTISTILDELPPLKGIVVHCSGGTSIEILKGVKANGYGVIYPFQTLTKNRLVDFNKVPIFIEANNDVSLQVIKKFAQSLSNFVHETDSDTRSWIHLSGVFTNNFVNHLLVIAGQILQEKKIDNNILKPLLIETIAKALSLGSSNSQTGPAARFDGTTIDKHINMLKQLNPELTKIYKELSLSIQSLIKPMK